ncbi:hypothetical protein DTO027B5_6876 [Paecilomyces variotii]|nr:hypothetical protein DTO169C6_7693 [Paecilomyces variotii]KAJ9321649.1 hypothetical protein DTO027B3_7297 [Paecilomyces variotii]KAJ9331316.1 hypothetical protein DTO027B5_6876 [Paecilomyces variotii]
MGEVNSGSEFIRYTTSGGTYHIYRPWPLSHRQHGCWDCTHRVWRNFAYLAYQTSRMRLEDNKIFVEIRISQVVASQDMA